MNLIKKRIAEIPRGDLYFNLFKLLITTLPVCLEKFAKNKHRRNKQILHIVKICMMSKPAYKDELEIVSKITVLLLLSSSKKITIELPLCYLLIITFILICHFMED